MNTQAVYTAIIQRQWKYRNHSVFGALAKRQIRKAVAVLRTA